MNPKSKEVLSQFLRIGLPIILSVVGGSLALSYGMQTKFDSLDRQKLMAAQKPNKLEQKKVDFDLEKEYEVASLVYAVCARSSPFFPAVLLAPIFLTPIENGNNR